MNYYYVLALVVIVSTRITIKVTTSGPPPCPLLAGPVLGSLVLLLVVSIRLKLLLAPVRTAALPLGPGTIRARLLCVEDVPKVAAGVAGGLGGALESRSGVALGEISLLIKVGVAVLASVVLVDLIRK